MCVDDALASAKALLARAEALGALEYGEFTLSSGQPSNFYFDGRLLSTDKTCVTLASQLLLDVLNLNGLECFGGPAVGAVPMIGGLAVLAEQQHRPFWGYFVRREQKQYGKYKKIEGHVEDGQTVAVYDDTISTGESLFSAIESLEQRDIKPEIATCILDRRQGGDKKLADSNIPLFSILVRTDEDKIDIAEDSIRYWFSLKPLESSTDSFEPSEWSVEPQRKELASIV